LKAWVARTPGQLIQLTPDRLRSLALTPGEEHTAGPEEQAAEGEEARSVTRPAAEFLDQFSPLPGQ